jgi:hypothetical protein
MLSKNLTKNLDIMLKRMSLILTFLNPSSGKGTTEISILYCSVYRNSLENLLQDGVREN